MNTASIQFKTEPKVKKQAQKRAEALGLNLSTVLNNFLLQFVKTKSAPVGEEIPNAKTRAILKKSEEDMKAGRVSPSFSNAKDAIAWLDDPNAAYENGDKVRDDI
jgi:addiction module RelB/DinJ family antitoxin